MQLEFALFCEAAKVAPDGIIHILHGGFDMVWVSSFPATMPRMVLVVRLLVNPAEFDREHELTCQMLDPGGSVLPVEIAMRFTVHPYPGNPRRANRMTFSLDYPNLVFPEAGNYQFRIIVDGIEAGKPDLDVRQHEPGA